MNVVLKPEIEKRVEERVRSGAYATAEDLLNEAVRQLLASDENAAARKPHAIDPVSLEAARDAPMNLEWLRSNREAHTGEWVALHKGRLIANGNDGLKVYNCARARGIPLPLMYHITEEEDLPFGGW